MMKLEEKLTLEARDVISKAYAKGASDALSNMWKDPKELSGYQRSQSTLSIITVYRSKYRGRWLTITSVTSVDEWMENRHLIHKGDELIAWMPIPELPEFANSQNK